MTSAAMTIENVIYDAVTSAADFSISNRSAWTRKSATKCSPFTTLAKSTAWSLFVDLGQRKVKSSHAIYLIATACIYAKTCAGSRYVPEAINRDISIS